MKLNYFDSSGMFPQMGLLQKLQTGKTPQAEKSGAFTEEGLGELGGEYNKYLLDMLKTPVTETQQFELGSEAIRESLARTSAGARQRLGEASTAGGWLDSGAVADASGDIDRAELQAFAGALRDLVMGLEQQRAAGVLPYLGLGVQESLGVEGLNVEAILAMKDLTARKIKDTSSELRGWYTATAGFPGASGSGGF